MLGGGNIKEYFVYNVVSRFVFFSISLTSLAQPLQPVNINIVVSNIFHLFLTEIFSGGGLTHGVSSAEDRQRLENSVALSQDSSLSASHPSCFTLSHLSHHPGLDSALPNKLQHQKCRAYIKYPLKLLCGVRPLKSINVAVLCCLQS